MTKVLITGGAGFVGYHLAKHLVTEDYEVHLIDDLSRAVDDVDFRRLSSNPKLKFLKRDLLQRDALDSLSNDYEYIYHLAAMMGVARVLKNPYAVLRDNILLLLHLLAFARRQRRLKRFLFTSTSEVYAGALKFFDLPIPTSESVPLGLTELSHPRTSYMLSKITGEALCQYSDIPCTIVRPHNIYGPRMGMAHVIPELLYRAHRANNNGCLELFSVKHRRTFCYIADGIAMLRRAAESDACIGQTLNIGNESPEITMEELAEIILVAVRKELKIIPKTTDSGSPIRRCPDMTETINRTGYKSRVMLEAGIDKTYDWYRSRIFDGKGVTAS